MPAADKHHLFIPFKEWAANLELDAEGNIEVSKLLRAISQEFENYKAIERWALDLSVPQGQTFQHLSTLTATESDIYYVPVAKSTRLLTGGVTDYGSGTVTVVLNKNGSQVGETLSITGTGLFTASIGVGWVAGDEMTVEITGTGTNCSGLVVQEIP